MKLLWLDLNSSYSHASLALPAIHAQVRCDEDWVWRRVSATTSAVEAEVVAEIVAEQPEVVCATVWLFTHEVAVRILSRVASLLPSTIVFLGGPEFLGDNESFLRRNLWATLLLRGEGEEAFKQWMRVWNRREYWSSVKGLCFLNDEGVYLDGGVAVADELMNLEPPYRSLFFPSDKPFVQFETSRGCFNTCAFCVSGEQADAQQLTLDQVREALDYFVEVGIKEVRVLDRTFNANAGRACAMLELFRSYHGQLGFHSEIHPALLTAEVCRMLESLPAGLMHLEAGVQSLVPEVIAECRRKGSVEKTLEGLQFLFSLSTMETHTDLIAGLPHYHFAQVVSDVVRLMDMKSPEIQLESLKLLPGTLFRRQAKRLGLVCADTPPYEVLQTPVLRFDEMRRLMKLSRLVDIYYNDRSWQELVRWLSADVAALLHLLDYCCHTALFDHPMSKERRGVILFEYIVCYRAELLQEALVRWVHTGLSLRALPSAIVESIAPSDVVEAVTLEGNVALCTRLNSLSVGGITLVLGYDRGVSQAVPLWIGRITR